MRQHYSKEDILKFIDELVNSPLAVSIYKQLLEDNGNTAEGLSKELIKKGEKASLTRVYEEIGILKNFNLIKKISKRPSIYTVNQTEDILNQLAVDYMIQKREDFQQKWAISYPFLPEKAKNTILGERNPFSLKEGEQLDLIANIYLNNFNGLKRCYKNIFLSNEINIIQGIPKLPIKITGITYSYNENNYQEIFNYLDQHYNTKGVFKVRILSNISEENIQAFLKEYEQNTDLQKMLGYFDYILKKPSIPYTSFIVNKKSLFLPLGFSNKDTDLIGIIETNDEKYRKKSQLSFNLAWEKSNDTLLKIDKGIIKEGNKHV